MEDELYVDSSVISRIKYYPALQTLEIEFKGDRVYHYSDVPRILWFNFRAAKSKGSFFNEKIKGYFTELRVK